MNSKYFFILIISLAIQTPTNAQVQYSLKAGIGVSQMKEPYSSQYNDGTRKPITGFTFGFQAQTKIWKHLEILGELSYIKKGGYQLSNIAINATYSHSGTILALDYIELPLLLRFKKLRSFDLGLGITTSYLLKAKFRDFPSNTKNLTKAYEKLDYGISGDILYRANKKVSIGLRYTYGLNKAILKKQPISAESTPQTDFYPNGRNKSFQLYITYTL